MRIIILFYRVVRIEYYSVCEVFKIFFNFFVSVIWVRIDFKVIEMIWIEYNVGLDNI